MPSDRRYFRPIKEDTIIDVLSYIRAEIVRDGLDGLEHVDALLTARGVDPEARHIPRKTDRRFKRGMLRAAVLRSLADGPKTGREIAEDVATKTEGLSAKSAYKRVYICLHGLKASGSIKHCCSFWKLSATE